MQNRFLSNENLLLIPAILLLALGPILLVVLPLTPRDRTALIALALIGAAFLAYVIRRARQVGLRNQYPLTPLLSLGLNLAGIFLLHHYFPAIDLILFVTVAGSGALWGFWNGLWLSLLAAAGYTAVIVSLTPFSHLNLLSLSVFDAQLIFIGGITGLLASHDQRRHMELEAASIRAARLAQELQALNTELEVRVAERTAEVREAQQAREELYEMLMHDLKSPLGTMISALHILREILPLDASAARQALESALKAGARQTVLIENLLDLQRLRAGGWPLQMEALDLAPLLHELVEQLGPRAGMKSIRMEERMAPGLPRVHADKQLLTRVIANLLENAYKFTPTHGQITVAARRETNALRVSVSDTGPGVPGPQRQMIFEKYQQVLSGESSARDGTGLGLTFCKMALQAQGGTISVGVSPSNGAQFEFTLPLHTPEADSV